MFEGVRIAVASLSFSKNVFLRKLLSMYFEAPTFNQGTCMGEDALVEFLGGHDAAIIGLEPISREVLQFLPELRVICKYGVGLDNIDQVALAEHGVHLGWTPGINAQSVAELTLCYMLALMRNIFISGFRLKNGIWEKDGGRQLFEKTIGIVGCGNVGKRVIKLLAPFRCRILVNDIVKYESFYREHDVEAVLFEDVMRRADIVSMHVPLDTSTRQMINVKSLSLMKPNAYLINTSRGGVVDTAALKSALREKNIAGAALDVFDFEPLEDRELLDLENLMVSPHIGGNAEEAVVAMGKSAVDHLVKFFACEKCIPEGRMIR